ncbi:Asp23/Gls24 family envelope stress response protein [Sinobaca sp. H24]|uniref:Asp23/Gls24 family envelope stress response protein n=1 Tax=Sinobaca sp. H24 TaxID=2923376 RepID=UPI002079EA48|nr:Asp23/Gls24 family envelope stress response protein [Sinobaca sp. H24]
MSDAKVLDIKEEWNELGRIEIAPDVIEVITALAVSEVSGVHSLRGNFALDVAEKLGRKNVSKGVKVDLGEMGVKIDVSVTMQYGVVVPQVAKELQKAIYQALRTMTSVAIDSINIHVAAIQLDHAETKEADKQN